MSRIEDELARLREEAARNEANQAAAKEEARQIAQTKYDRISRRAKQVATVIDAILPTTGLSHLRFSVLRSGEYVSVRAERGHGDYYHADLAVVLEIIDISSNEWRLRCGSAELPFQDNRVFSTDELAKIEEVAAAPIAQFILDNDRPWFPRGTPTSKFT